LRRRACQSLCLLLALGCASAGTITPDLERGDAALASGAAEDAADAFRSALAVDPSSIRALHGLARSEIARGDGESALATLSELAALDAGYFRSRAAEDQRIALEQAAAARLWRGDPSGALRLLDQLAPIEPARPGLFDLRVRALIAEAGRLFVAGRREAAYALYCRAIGEAPGRPHAVAALAEKLHDYGYTDIAITVLSDELRRRPGDPRLVALMDRILEIRYPVPP
jgi:tetratricopeptide (TPR) repeat protein